MKRPNILFIMSDDHAANAISCYGSRLAQAAPTPNIDRIAREGVRLDTCLCTNSICTPSRATIMTGQYSHFNGVRTLADDFDGSRQNVAKLLSAAGYQTAIIGKWHLHTQPTGFDYYNVLPGQGRYTDPKLKEKGKAWHDRNKGGEVYEGYVTDVTADLSIEWIRNRDTDRPFFLMCHNKAPHGLWEYAPRHSEYLEGIEIPEPDSLWEDKSHRSEASREYGSGMMHLATTRMTQDRYPNKRLDITGMNDRQIIKTTYQNYLKDYLRCVKAIDENVGRLLDFLDEENLTDNTLVIYTSDQGMFLGEHDYYDKRWFFEESLQMPFVARYPREIEPETVNSDIILNTDFAPLFLDYADCTAPPEMQGRSFRQNLSGQRPDDWRTSMYYRYWMHMTSHGNPAHYGIRTDRYKLIFFYGLPLDASGALPEPTPAGVELYDLQKDPGELKNVYNDPAYAEVAAQLKTELLKLKSECGDNDDDYPELMKLQADFL